MRSTSATDAAAPTEGAPPALLWIIWVLWLFFFAQPLSILLALPPSPQKALNLWGIVVFIGVYLWVTWQEAFRLTREIPLRRDTSWRTWWPNVILLGVALLMILLQGQVALGSMIYVSASLAGRLTLRQAMVALAGLTLLTALLGVIIGAPLGAYAQVLFIVPAVGSVVYFFSRAIRTNQELRRARQEIARLAVSEERLRFARDLHDLLGHTLSLITLKSELARRLVSTAPEQAATEISDIETAARQALTEVREAVAGYRQPTLADELSAARELLAAAGIAFTQHGEPTPLATGAEAALAWAVREGVTNVIRHSQARSCVITLIRDGSHAGVEICDDGAAGRNEHTQQPFGERITRGGPGNGLTGLSERVATLGGSCTAGAVAGGGYRLAVSLPQGTELGTERTLEPESAGERAETRATVWFG